MIPRLQAELPELLVLGDYAPDKRTGPAIWLRCVIAGTVDDLVLPEGDTPIEMEKRHGGRRGLVWAELGEAPLASALEHLAMLAEVTATSLAAGTPGDLAARYRNGAWRADDAVVRALACVERTRDLDAITLAVRAVYLPWAEESARHLQRVVDDEGYPGGSCLSTVPPAYADGECLLFVDGLRFDTGQRLLEILENEGFDVVGEATWAALPSVTATGKAAVTPVADKIRGSVDSVGFEPTVAETGQSLKGGHHLKKLLVDAGWALLDRADNGNGVGNAWCAYGDIDHEGHDRGWKLARQLPSLLEEISDRVAALLAAGWKSVRVVTDHGWLLLPGGLPKIDLPSALVDTKWGRCADLKPGATSAERLFPWYWEPNRHFALADGISCFKRGEEYAHGGLSLQECLTLQLRVSGGPSAGASRAMELTDIRWVGLRCTVAADGDFAGLSLDVRTQAGDAASSVVVSVKPLKKNGTASVVVEDEDLEGCGAAIVLLDERDGALIAQHATVIGGGER